MIQPLVHLITGMTRTMPADSGSDIPHTTLSRLTRWSANILPLGDISQSQPDGCHLTPSKGAILFN